MKNAFRGAALKILLSLALAVGVATGAQASIVENVNGGFSVAVSGQIVVIPENVATSVIGALGEARNNSADLEEAMKAIVAAHAGGADNAPLATAIAALAISRSGGSSAAVTAIINGVAQGNASATPQMVLRTLSENLPRAPRGQLRSRGARDTAEDLSRSISPVRN